MRLTLFLGTRERDWRLSFELVLNDSRSRSRYRTNAVCEVSHKRFTHGHFPGTASVTKVGPSPHFVTAESMNLKK